MRSSRFSFLFFFLALLVVSMGVVVFRIPEARSVTSEDGAVTVTGLVRTKTEVRVVVADDVFVGTPLLGHAYHIDPDGVVLDAPVTLSFARDEAHNTIDATTVYQWHAALGTWVPVTSIVADTGNILAVEVMTLGDFALGTSPHVAVPTLLSLQDALQAKAPAGTRGFRFVPSYTLEDGVPIAMLDDMVFGGCGGFIGAGGVAEYSSVSQTVEIFVDDVAMPVDVMLTAEWRRAPDGTGCPAMFPLKIQEDML